LKPTAGLTKTANAPAERPKTIGIVTSATGAALQDMLNTLRGRYCLADVVIAPAAVQGV
jgi:exodeoxyribonuclease VII large subunit